MNYKTQYTTTYTLTKMENTLKTEFTERSSATDCTILTVQIPMPLVGITPCPTAKPIHTTRS